MQFDRKYDVRSIIIDGKSSGLLSLKCQVEFMNSGRVKLAKTMKMGCFLRSS